MVTVEANALSPLDTTDKGVGRQDVGKQDVGKQDVGRQDVGKQDVGRQDVGKQDVGRQDVGRHICMYGNVSFRTSYHFSLHYSASYTLFKHLPHPRFRLKILQLPSPPLLFMYLTRAWSTSAVLYNVVVFSELFPGYTPIG